MPQFEKQDGTGFMMNYDVLEWAFPTSTLFIHGNLASNRWWHPVLKLCKEKARGQKWKGRFISAEFRGCGKSSPPSSAQEVTLATFVDDYLQLVANFDEIKAGKKINLVGHSTGGLIAALMLAQKPEWFERAVLLDPVGAQGVRFEPAMEQAFQAMKSDKKLVATVMQSTIYKCDPEDRFFKEVIVEDAFHAVQTVGSGVLAALSNIDQRQDLSRVEHKVLTLHGDQDQILPLEESKKLSHLFKNGTFEVLVQQGHCCNVENPKLFVDRLHSFLFA